MLYDNATDNVFQFADYTPNIKARSIIDIRKAVVHLYTTFADSTVAHTDGVKGLNFVKTKIPINIYFHSVLQSLSALDLFIECKL